MSKQIKITEEQFNEIIDSDGSIISGDYIDSDSKVKTNYFRKTQQPQTSDDFADETGDRTKWYNYSGFSISEAAEYEVDMDNDTTYIPQYTELSKSYEQPKLQNDLDNVSRQLNSLGLEDEQDRDVKAIVLKQILMSVDYSSFSQEQKTELQKLMDNG